MNSKSSFFAAAFALILSTVAVGSAVMPAQVAAYSNPAVANA